MSKWDSLRVLTCKARQTFDFVTEHGHSVTEVIEHLRNREVMITEALMIKLLKQMENTAGWRIQSVKCTDEDIVLTVSGKVVGMAAEAIIRLQILEIAIDPNR